MRLARGDAHPTVPRVRILRTIEPAIVLAAIGCLLALAVRAWMGRSSNDALRGMLLAGVAWAAVPLLWRTAELAAWRARVRSAAQHLHRACFDHPGRMAGAWFGAWAVSHALFAVTLADPRYGLDLAFFVQGAANSGDPRGPLFITLLHGEPGRSFYQHHWSPFLHLLQPLTLLPSPGLWFSLLQDASMAGFLYLALALVRDGVRSRGARLVVAGALLANPFWSGLIHFEFHEYGFVPLLGLALHASWRRRSLLGWCGCCLLLLSLKETLAIGLAWLGLAMLARSAWRRDAMGAACSAVALLGGTVVYLCYVRVVIPATAYAVGEPGQGMFLTAYYGHLGSSVPEIALSPILRPGAFAESVLRPTALAWLATWLAACALVGAAGWRWTLLVVPELAMSWLSSAEAPRNPVFHYGAVLLPVSLLMLIDGAAVAERARLVPRWRAAMLLAGLAAACAVARSPMPERLRGLAGPDGLRALPFVRSLPQEGACIANTWAGLQHAAARPDAAAVLAVPGREAPRIVPGVRWYLLHDGFAFADRDRVVELRRHGPWALCEAR